MPTVTNTYENKDAAALARISPNLIAAEPTVDAVCAALAQAEAASEHYEDRSGRLPRQLADVMWNESLDDESWLRWSACLG